MDIQTPIPSIYGYFNEKFGTIWEQLIQASQTQFGSALENIDTPLNHKVDMPVFFISKTKAHEFLKWLKEEKGFSFLTDYTASDEETNPRFLIIIHLMNPEDKCRIRVKIKIAENEKFETLIPIWEGANWAEREIYDMFGIQFSGHPDLRRILMDMRWEGHPLRKDYPLRGYQVFLTPEPLDPELLK